ncbi:MAG: VWA domain-containing protein [Bryobacteraceae bacterium]
MLHTSTRGRSRGAAVALVVLLLSPVAAPAARISPQRGPVSLYVTVEDRDGFVHGLGPGNFRLFEDGHAMPFRLEAPESPAHVVILAEFSRLSAPYLLAIRRAIYEFPSIAPEGHWYALATFDRQLEVRVDFTRQRGRIPVGYFDLGHPAWRELAAYDAVYELIEKLERLPGRRVLILIGSGVDTDSTRTFAEVQRKTETSDVIVYGIGTSGVLRTRQDPFSAAPARMRLMQGDAFLQKLAERSGGYAWFPGTDDDFPAAMRNVMLAIESQYRLVYQPREEAVREFRRVRVEAFQIVNDRRRNPKVRVRSGWRFPDPG